MEQSPEEGQDFTVVDKRRAHGPEEEDAGPESPRASSPTEGEAPRSRAQEFAPTSALTPDLSSLFLMLATSAVIHLGQAPDPVTGQPTPDLAQARYAIDLLELLKEKTEGHRSPTESQLLDEILYDLRMRYVQVSRRG